MSLNVVDGPGATDIDAAVGRAKVVLESDSKDLSVALEEVQSNEAANKALAVAALRGIVQPRHNGFPRPYVVDMNGQEFQALGGKGISVRYRADYPITAALH